MSPPAEALRSLWPALAFLLAAVPLASMLDELGFFDAAAALVAAGTTSVLGLSHLHPGAFSGVPISTDDTGEAQRRRLEECGYTVGLVDPLPDFDHPDAAREIAAMVPGSRFARAVDRGIPPVEELDLWAIEPA